MLSTLYGAIRSKISVERIVALLTPLFAIAAGAIALWVAQHFPGLPSIDPGWLAGIFAVGAASAVAAALKWLDGRLKWTTRELALETSHPGGTARNADSVPPPSPDLAPTPLHDNVGSEAYVEDGDVPEESPPPHSAGT